MSGIEFTVGEPTKPEPKTEAGENLKKIMETPVELGMVNDRGLGVIDGQSTTERAAAKLNAESAVEPNQVLLDEMAPCLEVEMPSVGAPDSELLKVTPNQTAMIQRAKADPGDPTVLLQGLLGQMPGVDSIRAADMAMGTDMALYNLGTKAERMAKLEERAARRAEREKSGRGRGKKRRRR